MNIRRILSALLFAAGLVLIAAPASGQQQEVRKESYGNTPEALVPYRQFKEPYVRYFIERHVFLGTGREKPAPAGLETVKIGFMGPLDERDVEAPFGRRMLWGALLAIEEANAAGGYRGTPYELVVRDDVGPWGASSNKIVELDREKVWCVLGSIDGASTHIAIRVALKLELPVVTTGGTDPTLTETRIPWYIRVNADDRQNGYALASYIFGQKGARRVAALRINSRYGRAGIGEFRDAARRLGLPLLLELRYGPNDRDFRSQLEKIRAAKADAVVLWGNPEDMGLIVRQMRAMGMEQPVFGPDRITERRFLDVAGPAAEGVIGTYWFDPTRRDPAWLAFGERYERRFGEPPEQYAAHAYDGMRIIIEAVERAGLNRARIRDELTAIETYHGVTGEIVMDGSWNDVGPIVMVEVKDGAFRFFPSPLPPVRRAEAKPAR